MSSVHDTRNDDNSDSYASPDPDSRRKGGNDFDDRHSRHKHNSRGSEQDRLRTREHYRHREKDQERHHWEYKDRSAGPGRGRVSYDDYDRHMGRGYDRGGNFSQDKEGRSRHRRRSRSRDRFGDQPRPNLQSHSPSKNKRASGFDMPPPGADAMPNAAVPAEQAGVPQAIPGMLQNMLLFGSTQLGVQTMTQQATRHARRVYVGGLPPLANEQTIASFFSHIMAAIGGNSSGPGDAVVNVYINHEKKFAFVEMRTVAEASNAMALDGIVFEGVSVRVRRPTDYNPALAAALGPSQPSPHLNLAALGLTPGANGGAEGPGRIFVGGLPYFFSESQIRELLESFGPLSGFDLVKDRDTGNSKGYAFCAYQDPAVTDEACRALNGVKMGDKILTVRRATANGQVKSDQETILSQAQQHIAMQMALQTGGLHLPGVGMVSSVALDTPTKILCLSEVITAHELGDDNEYEEILEDMKEEGAKFGALVDVVIPRPNPNGEQNPGVGKVFLEYSDVAGCANARSALSGRKFGGNTVSTIYYPEDKYHNKDYSV